MSRCAGGVETHCIDLAIETRIADNATHSFGRSSLANSGDQYSADSVWVDD